MDQLNLKGKAVAVEAKKQLIGDRSSMTNQVEAMIDRCEIMIDMCEIMIDRCEVMIVVMCMFTMSTFYLPNLFFIDTQSEIAKQLEKRKATWLIS